jgi:hypothetical protein
MFIGIGVVILLFVSVILFFIVGIFG